MKNTHSSTEFRELNDTCIELQQYICTYLALKHQRTNLDVHALSQVQMMR